MYSAAFVISPVLSFTATIFSISASFATVAGVIVTFVFGLLLYMMIGSIVFSAIVL